MSVTDYLVGMVSNKGKHYWLGNERGMAVRFRRFNALPSDNIEIPDWVMNLKPNPNARYVYVTPTGIKMTSCPPFQGDPDNCRLPRREQYEYNMIRNFMEPKDMTSEFKDLLDIYEKGLKKATAATEERLSSLTYYMKAFLQDYECRNDIQTKLEALKYKLHIQEPTCDDCEDE